MTARLCILMAVVATFFFLLWRQRQQNHLYVTFYDYLRVLSTTKWKSAVQIQEDLERPTGGWIELQEVHLALGRLVEEKLVERREAQGVIAPESEYRKVEKEQPVEDDIFVPGDLVGAVA